MANRPLKMGMVNPPVRMRNLPAVEERPGRGFCHLVRVWLPEKQHGHDGAPGCHCHPHKTLYQYENTPFVKAALRTLRRSSTRS